MRIDYEIDRALCPGCSAPLTLTDAACVVRCPYCGSESKVIRRLRKMEPEIPQLPLPEKKGDPLKNYGEWGTEQLLHGIFTGTEMHEKIAMAHALDEWFHVNDIMASYLYRLVDFMNTAPLELDRELSGIVGKMICSDTLAYRLLVIQAGEKYAFTLPGSKGLVFALSLGDAATVKLLLDIAEWASKAGAHDFAEEALIGVQTAIGRTNDRQLPMEILIYRFLYVSDNVQQWMARFIRNHFDVGYTDLYILVLELIDDCVREKPRCASLLAEALKKCWNAGNREEYHARLQAFEFLHSFEAKKAACLCLGHPPSDVTSDDVEYGVRFLLPLATCAGFEEPAASALSKLVWTGNRIPSILMNLYEKEPARLPPWVIDAIKLRVS